jgi:hypothetical protein
LTDTRDKLCAAAVLLALVNFAAFFCIALLIGGDALNGHSDAGHYYLNNHGRLTEVSRAVFTYSKWHAISVLVTHPLAILCGWLLARRNKNLTGRIEQWRRNYLKR